LNRLEVRVEKLERPANDRYSELLEEYGGPEGLREVVDGLEAVLAEWRGLPRADVRIDLRREGLFGKFTTAELVEFRDTLERSANKRSSV
jgi:hypothetical protein